MTKAFVLHSLIYLTIAFSCCKSQSKDDINLSKIIFHSSACYGTCPNFDLEIDSNKNYFVNRQYYISRGEKDTAFSGQFNGILNQNDYKKLIGLLQDCHIDTLKFPDITCCDGGITTIIIYYNGQRKYLKSMEPPIITKDLIFFLNKLGNDKQLQETKDTKLIEE